MRKLAWSESYHDIATENVGRTSWKAGKSLAPTAVCPGVKTPGFTSMKIGRFPGLNALSASLLVHERQRQLVTHAGVQGDSRPRAELVLKVTRVEPPDSILIGVGGGPAELRSETKQEVGGGVSASRRWRTDEREVAVRAIHERDHHVLFPDVDAELHRVSAGNPRQIIGELKDLVDAIDERLLLVTRAEETGDHDVRQASR